MSDVIIRAERTIAAPADELFTYLADYRNHHPKILPPAFSDFQVEQGGVGAGTVVSYRLQVGGRRRPGRARIEEPAPGVLAEHIEGTDIVTTFKVQPEESGSTVRIETRWPARGVRGVVERWFVPRMLHPLYVQELELLDDYAARCSGSVTQTVGTR